MSDDKKCWERPWCPKEIAENASNWSLAADMRLLKYLEVFSEDILNQATTVDNNVNSLLNNLSKASLSLDIARNKFLSLSNTQFIECRVYEDDETLLSNEEKNEKEEPNKNSTEESNKNEMRLAALRGVEVINKYFDKVAVVDSDSEEDSDLTSFVLRPKDPYIDRPLPYVIGTEKWYKKLHVGLADSSSESEDGKVSEKFSDTDSESDLPITNRSQAKSISESGSSEADLSNRLDNPVANSTLNDTNKADEYLGSNEDYNSVPMPAPISQNTFAEQLAAKLGVVANNTIEEPPVNTRPIQKHSDHDRYRNMFSDEPPPLNDFDDFSPKSKDQGIFSGGDGLFDDLNDDEPFWGSGVSEKQNKGSTTQEPIPNLFESDDNDFVSRPKTIPKAIDDDFKKQLAAKVDKMIERSPFDDEAESDEDFLFKKPSAIKKPISNKSKKQESLFDDDEDDDDTILQTKERFPNRNFGSGDGNRDTTGLFDADDLLNSQLPKKKAPVGGIQVIENPNIFSEIKKFHQIKHQASTENPTNEVPTQKFNAVHDNSKESKQLKSETETSKSTTQNRNKVNRLFDDDNEEDDLFKDDLFSSFSSKKTSGGGLFDDDGSEDHPENTRTIGASIKITGEPLKDVDEDSATSANGLLKAAEHGKPNIPKKFEDQLHVAPPKMQEVSSKKTSKNIFSLDEDSDSDDLFASKNSKIISKNKIIENSSSISESDNTDPSHVASTKDVKRRTVPSLFDDDNENEDDDLFSSNFLQIKKPVSISKKPESNLDSSKNNKLFDDDDEDDLFSTKSSSSDNYANIFANGRLFNVGEPMENKSKTLTKSSAIAAKTSKQEDIFGGNSSERTSEHMEDASRYDDPKSKFEEVQDSVNFKSNEGHSSESKVVLNKSHEANHNNRHLYETDVQKQYEENSKTNNVLNDSKVEFLENRVDEDMIQNGDGAKSVPRNDSLSEITLNFQEKNSPEEKSSSNTLDQSRSKQSETDEKAPIKSETASPQDISISEELLPRLHAKNILQELNQENEDYSFLSSTASSSNAHDSPADRVPPVNIFDPNPPPDIEDWDDRPEPNIFYDDIYTFDNTENFSENRSSIFDREPPSVFNETSGIVKDQSVRLDTDTSSFYPYATSSRRFSNDLFNEEQSNDSLFTAKNNINSFEPNIPPSITEDTEEPLSNVDITPSGKLEDLYSEASISRNPKSVTFEDNISIKNELNQRETQEIGTSETVASSTTENLSNHGTEDVKVGKPKPALLKKPNLGKKVPLPQEKVYEAAAPDNTNKETISEEDTSTSNKEKREENKGQPQKLKHKLDINVFALLPGAGKPPKKENPVETKVSQPRQRSTSLDLEERENNIVSPVTSPNEMRTTSPAIKDSIGDVEVLESVTKTRARGPVKRRPSTKRGRDAIRNSCIEFSFETSPSIEDYHNKVNKGISNDTHQTFKNDLEPKFYQHPNDVIDSTNSVKLETNKSRDNAESSNEKESALLIENNLTTKLENHSPSKDAIPPRKNLFSDDMDSDDMIFNFNAKKSDTSSNILPKKSVVSDESRHVSLDKDRDQDLFGQKQKASSLEVAEDSLCDKDHSESLLKSKDKLQDSYKKTASEISIGILTQEEVQVDGSKAEPMSDSLIGSKTKAGAAKKSQISSTRDLFDDDTDDDDLFSSATNRKLENDSLTSKMADPKSASISGANHPSRSVPSIDFGVSSDEDIFSAKKTGSKKPDMIKRLPFDDDDDDDLFGSTSKERQQVSTASIPSRRLKTSNLKKLENTILTGDDPLNALNN